MIGPNQYGDDPLPPDIPSSDALDRFVGKNAVVKIFLILALIALWIAGAIIYPRSSPQQRFNAAVNQELSHPSGVYTAPASSLPIAVVTPSSSAPSGPNPPQAEAPKPAPGWKTLTVAMASSPQPTCYALSYPSYFTPSKFSNQPGYESFLQQQSDGSWNGITVEPDFADTYDSIVQQQEGYGATPESITTDTGFTGTVLKVPAIKFWEIFIPVSQNGVHYVVAIYPENRNDPYDPSVAQAMAQSLAFSCRLPSS
jgi:hypothetical protein